MKNKEISKESVDYNGAEFLLTEEEYEKYSAHVKQQAELFLKPYLESFIDGKHLDECEEPCTFTDVVENAICIQKNAITMLMLDYPEVQISELESGGDYIDNEEDIMDLADLLPFGHVMQMTIAAEQWIFLKRRRPTEEVIFHVLKQQLNILWITTLSDHDLMNHWSRLYYAGGSTTTT